MYKHLSYGRDNRATVVCCAYVRKVHCAVVGIRRALHKNCLFMSRSGVFRRRWVTFSEHYTPTTTNHCWCQKNRVIALSCGIKISAVHNLVLSQYTRLADGRPELRQQYHALHYMQSHGKNVNFIQYIIVYST